MKTECWWIGNTQESYINEGIRIYEKRLKHYLPLELVQIPDLKLTGKWEPEQIKVKEGALVLSRLRPGDFLVLLDERGTQYSSLKFASWLDQQTQRAHKRIIFLVGGAFGFSPAVYERANATVSLSGMTFSHQMIRLFFLEQLYRAMTILRNESYHNE